jgi:hypothetical protein
VNTKPHYSDEPFPVHQRRFLINLADGTGKPPAAGLAWQYEYVGGMFISIPPGPSGELVVRRVVATGYSPALVTFCPVSAAPGFPELLELVSELGPSRLLGADSPWSTVAELVAVGATHAAGVSTAAIVAARIIASHVNSALGASELPLPVELMAPAAPVPQWLGSASRISGRAAVALRAEGARRLAPEIEQRTSLIRAAAVATRQDQSERAALCAR